MSKCGSSVVATYARARRSVRRDAPRQSCIFGTMRDDLQASGAPPDWLAEYNAAKGPKMPTTPAGPGRRSRGRRRPPLRTLHLRPRTVRRTFVALYKASPFRTGRGFRSGGRTGLARQVGAGEARPICCASSTARPACWDMRRAPQSPLMNQMVLQLDRRLRTVVRQVDARRRGEADSTWWCARRTGSSRAGGRIARPHGGGRRSRGAGGGNRARRSPAGTWRSTCTRSFISTAPATATAEAVRRLAAEAALAQPAVADYYTADGACSTNNEWQRRFQNSFHPKRSGDVMLTYRPEYVEDFGARPRHFLRLAVQLRRARAAVLLRSAIPPGRLRYAGGSGGRGAHAGAGPWGSRSPPRRWAACWARPCWHERRGDPPRRCQTNCAASLCENPVLAASGTFGYGVEFEKLVDLNALGGLVVKGLSREPIEGNPPPRVV